MRGRYVWPRSGLAAAAIDLQTNSTIGIFMIQGMNLRRGEAAKALLSYKASLYGALSILFITPLFGARPTCHNNPRACLAIVPLSLAVSADVILQTRAKQLGSIAKC